MPLAKHLLALLIVGTTACGAAPLASAAPRHDEPVAAAEPRESVRLRVDLPKTASCEETFDLALYAHRGIDLVEWGEPSAKCAGRTVRIRYLPKRISRAEVLDHVRALAAGVAEVAQ